MKVTLTPEEVEQRLARMTKAQRKLAAGHLKTETKVFAWRVKPPQSAPKQKPEPEVFGTAVGVGEDWSHLNKRRQRAREESIRRDVKWLRELDAVKQTEISQ